MHAHALQATPVALAGPRRHTITGSLSSLSAHQYFPTEASSNSTANNNNNSSSNNNGSNHNSSSNHNSNSNTAALVTLNALESLQDMPHADAVTEAHVVADVLPRPLSIGFSSLHGGRGIQPVAVTLDSSGYRHNGFRNEGLVLPSDAPPSPLVMAASSEYEAWRSRANSASHDDHEDAGMTLCFAVKLCCMLAYSCCCDCT
jgi:hypothetical protein